MTGKQLPDWELIYVIARKTATAEEQARWSAWVQLHPEQAGLPDYIRELEPAQKDIHSPFYAKEAYEKLYPRLREGKRSSFPVTGARIRPLRSAIARMTAAAAILAGILFFGWQIFHRSPRSLALKVIKIPNGARRQLLLPDSSVLWVNAGSTVSIPQEWSDSSREIELEGEGFFDIRSDPQRPFLVHVRNATVKVLGTSFNIHAYPSEPVAVAVATGRVLLRSETSGHGQILARNEKAVLDPADGNIHSSNDSADTWSQWIKGGLQFRDSPLQEAIHALERHYNIRLELTGESRGLYCTAKYEADESLENVLKSLQAVYNFHITRVPGHYKLTLPPAHNRTLIH
jgi:ferric-dicitrate binding protein FerR (iron transport regulator)